MLSSRHFVSGVSSIQSLSRSAGCASSDCPAALVTSTSPRTRRRMLCFPLVGRPNCALSPMPASLRNDSFEVGGFGFVETRGLKRDAPLTTPRAGGGSVDLAITTNEPIHLMVVSDLDFTMVDHKDSESTDLLRFNMLWAADYAHNSLLVFSSGRSPEKYQQLRREVPLLTPDVGIFSVGTEILYGSSLDPDVGWENYLNEGWNRDLVLEEAQKFPALRFQEDSEQRPHKVSFFVEKDLAKDIVRDLTQRLKDCGLKVKLIYSGGYALDVLPQGAGKGEALAYLLKQLKEKNKIPKETLVCGDSGNDAELYTVEGVKGVIVGNAMEELLHWYDALQSKDHIFKATQRCAGGIIQAIEHFALGSYEVPADRIKNSSTTFDPESSDRKPASGSATREIVDVNTALVMWVNGDIPNTDAAHNRILGVMAEDGTMVYPWGEERLLRKSVVSYKSKHGLKKDSKVQVWMDCIKEQKLADNIILVSWQSWQQSTSGENRKGNFATAILRTKMGTPNGLEWVRVHETPRQCN
ncbi:sucrose-6-phosphatase [Marchantia polymorpha subsp. ruderalis]|uniref:sucrose-phosphate phosphatase n=1 Tax=Marchantia polymorpha TaxID=3197 RepID=A0A2R6WKY5_MARPO|nr:hypothetical protein MARPO_0079s0029 [Marchantia polymorpha]BBN20033.1 hypothetical protein Mp_8g15830 [Marchantia polymorpha subsp. ruderalis]|eukprot:PTQ34519.1 hypothetical protein MARPO_0079s0029 [Marchantia polymorpha]